jgi:hypothetical protein
LQIQEETQKRTSQCHQYEIWANLNKRLLIIRKDCWEASSQFFQSERFRSDNCRRQLLRYLWRRSRTTQWRVLSRQDWMNIVDEIERRINQEMKQSSRINIATYQETKAQQFTLNWML